jgi:hypothetical protein
VAEIALLAELRAPLAGRKKWSHMICYKKKRKCFYNSSIIKLHNKKWVPIFLGDGMQNLGSTIFPIGPKVLRRLKVLRKNLA